MSLGDRAASEGIGGLLLAFLLIAAVFGLIYAVLEIMNKVNAKHSTEEKEIPMKNDKEFSEVLSDEMKKIENKDDRV